MLQQLLSYSQGQRIYIMRKYNPYLDNNTIKEARICILARLILAVACIFFFLPIRVDSLPAFREYKSETIGYENLICPKEIPRFLILKLTGEKKDGLPVLEIFSEDAENKKAVEHLFENSFMKESVILYFLAQNYLINQGISKNHEPAYLLLSNEQGGFPKFGFYLKKDDADYLDKRKTPYIELVKNNNREENFLGSMTQIYPHEMGHIIYQMLSEITQIAYPRSCDVHYSTITTDYRTAFHEGFAIHFENVSRMYEPNSELKEAITQDILRKKKMLGPYIAGYVRDFKLPLRLDYYRTSMLIWYQNFDMLKRYEWIKSGWTKHMNATINAKNIEKALFYRNSGIAQDTRQLRILQQALATEGVIAAFFTQLIEGNSKHRYLGWDFYRSFLCDPGSPPPKPEVLLPPLLNLYIKMFVVLHKYVNSNRTERPQILDFIDGYIKEFPEEKEEIRSIFKFATGYDVPDCIGPELWVLNKKHKHGFLVMDQFGGNVAPFYSFDLNTAEAVDLGTFKEISKEEAQTIIDHRNEKGSLTSFDEIATIPGISTKTAETLKAAVYDLDYINRFEEELEFNILKMILLNIAHPFLKGVWTFLIFLVIYYVAFLKRQPSRGKLTIKLVFFKLLKMILYIFIGLLCVILPMNSILIFTLVILCILLIQILLKRDRQKRKDALFSTCLMWVLMLYSLW
jgi:hypothetical protein